MTKKQKIIFMLLSVFCFFIGWLLGGAFQNRNGKSSSFQAQLEAVGVFPIDQIVSRTSIDTTVIDLIDSGRIDDAKQLLFLQQDGDILTINELLVTANAHSVRQASTLFSRILRHRSEKPFYYNGGFSKEDTNTLLKVDEAISKYK